MSTSPKSGASSRRAGAPRPDEMSPEVFEFLTAIDDFKRTNLRSFLALEEIFQVFDRLGYHPDGRALDERAIEELSGAIEQYKLQNERLFPSWSEVFQVALDLGWTR
jgi:hypothetical protein